MLDLIVSITWFSGTPALIIISKQCGNMNEKKKGEKYERMTIDVLCFYKQGPTWKIETPTTHYWRILGTNCRFFHVTINARNEWLPES